MCAARPGDGVPGVPRDDPTQRIAGGPDEGVHHRRAATRTAYRPGLEPAGRRQPRRQCRARRPATCRPPRPPRPWRRRGAASLGVRAVLGAPRRAARGVAVSPSAPYLRIDGPAEPIILALVTSDAVRPPNAVVLAAPARQEPFRGIR